MKKRQQLGFLFEKYHLDLRRLIAFKFKKNSHDAEDIVQEAFHNILKSDNIDTLENPKAYLFQAANNLALNRIRKQKRHNDYIAEQNADVSYDLTPERSVTARKDLERLENSMDKLPEKYRRTFLMSRVDFKSYRQISEELGIAESTVEKHIIKTLKYLRDQLEIS